jgi:hypothetical protein
MRLLPMMTMQTTKPQLAFEAGRGVLVQSQQRASLTIETQHGSVRAPMTQGTLTIDSAAARDALGGGSVTTMLDRNTKHAQQLVMDAIARIAEVGDRLAKIDGSSGSDVIADIAYENATYRNPYSYVGEAAAANVRITYEPKPVVIDVSPTQVRISATPHTTSNTFERGHWQASLAQWPSLTITPPKLDVRA